MESFGDYLKTQREKKAIRLEEIASITKIHLHNLELLERSQWEELPPEPFIRGFITAYAKYVGLDPKDALSRYYGEKGTPTPGPSLATPDQPANEDGELTPSKVIEQAQEIPSGKLAVAAGIVAVLLVTGGIIYVGKRSPSSPTLAAEGTEQGQGTASPDAAAPSAEQKPAQTAASSGEAPRDVADNAKSTPAEPKLAAASPVTSGNGSQDSKTAPAGTTAPGAGSDIPAHGVAKEESKHEVLVEGNERTWIKVVIDEQPPVEFFLKGSEKAIYRAKDKIKVVLGYANGAKIFHNGELNEGVKFAGTIRYYKFPANSRFPQDTSSKRNTSAATDGESTRGGGAQGSTGGGADAKVLAPLKELLSQ